MVENIKFVLIHLKERVKLPTDHSSPVDGAVSQARVCPCCCSARFQHRGWIYRRRESQTLLPLWDPPASSPVLSLWSACWNLPPPLHWSGFEHLPYSLLLFKTPGNLRHSSHVQKMTRAPTFLASFQHSWLITWLRRLYLKKVSVD